MTTQPCYITIKKRGLITISGADSRNFLQNLITVDIRSLNDDNLLYGCLLTPQGKFLHDFFIAQSEDSLLLECEGGERTADLYKRLSMYKLRANVDIAYQDDTNIFAVFGTDGYGLPDPRHKDMGYRSFTQPENIMEKPFEIWDQHRIRLTIPDGSRDLVVAGSTMDEANMDQLGAISYDKGCYLGQELTARMHYRGLGKKHLQTVRLDALPDGAELRSSCGDIGIALVRG